MNILILNALTAQRRELQAQLHHLNVKIDEARRELSEENGWMKTGYKVDDEIEFTKRKYAGSKPETIRIIIRSFGIHIMDGQISDAYPSITGVRILKNGQVGVKEETCWESSENVKIVRKG